jgi:hypothetical protein
MNSFNPKDFVNAWQAQQDFNYFLQKRKLFDETSADFGQNPLSQQLENNINPKPLILFSCIPKPFYRLKSAISLNDFKNWLQQNEKGYAPIPTQQLFRLDYNNQVSLDGFIFNRRKGQFFEIYKTGFLEVCDSQSFTYLEQKDGKTVNWLYITPIIGYEMLLLSFIKRFYEMLQYKGELLFQLSFVNILNFKLHGWYEGPDWYHREEDFKNKYHQNFKIVETFTPDSLSESTILNMAKAHSETICSCFGFEKELAFNAENKINTARFRLNS